MAPAQRRRLSQPKLPPSLPTAYYRWLTPTRRPSFKVEPEPEPEPEPPSGDEAEEQEQGREKVGCTDTKFKMNVIENELSKIVGLDALKLQLRTWLKGMLLDQRRRATGIAIGPRKLPQLVFLGNPGTGKTMIARMLSKLLYMVGILQTKKVIEVQRTDLVGSYSGHTGPKTREMVKKAEGGILFVDEAYQLISRHERDFGIEALEEIMSSMDSGKVVIIFAGYTDQMDILLSSNAGMRRRISNTFHFDDFTCEQLAKIMHLKLSTKDKKSSFYGYKLDARSTSISYVAALIKRETTQEQRGKMNGGLVDQMLVKARENLDSRTDVECTDKYDMVAITSEDLAIGLQSLRAQGGSTGNNNAHKMEEDMKKAAGELKLDPIAIGDMIYNSLKRGFEKFINEFPPPPGTTFPKLKKCSKDPVIE